MGKGASAEIGLICPFCSAPYRGIVPSNVAQIKCKYCGGTFSISSYFRETAPRCPNHPDLFGTSLCNDCGEHFCTQCLEMYELKTNGTAATLYLCPNCLRHRKLGKANAIVFMGIFFIVAFGLFWLLISPMAPPEGGLMVLIILLFAVVAIIYGIWKRGSILLEEDRAKTSKENSFQN